MSMATNLNKPPQSVYKRSRERFIEWLDENTMLIARARECRRRPVWTPEQRRERV